MKKIKLLLGIGLLGALFSTCFGVRITAFEYYYNNGQTSYSFDGLGRNLRPIMNIDNGFNTGLLLNYKKGYSSTDTGVLLLSSYLQSGVSNSLLGTINRDYFSIYFNSDLNFIGLVQSMSSNTSTSYNTFYYKFTTGDYDPSITAGFNVSSNISSFIRVKSDFENCFYDGRFNGNCIASRFFIHTITSTYDSFTKSSINDSVDNGITYNKGPVVSVIGDTYSFFMSDGLGTGSSDLNSSTFIPRIRVPDTSNMSGYTINGLFAMKLNTYSKLSSDLSNYQILVLQITGFDTQNYDFIYSIYDCPGNSSLLSSCTFNEGGYLRPSTATYHFQSSGDSLIVFNNTGRDNLLFLLSYPFDYSFTPNYSSTIYNSYDSLTDTLTIYRPLISSVSDFNNKSRGYSLTLQSSDGINILDGVDFPGGNGNQSSGSMAINSGLISLCLTSPSFYDLNTIFCNRVFGGRDLSYIQGLISSGAYLQSYVDGSGNLVYVIDIVDESGVLTGGVSWECYGDRCINTEFGSWGDVEPREILHLSGGDILSSGYYLGFFESINETGYFFKCPYSYNNSRWVAGRSILNAIGRDPFLPINCFIAAYENGRRVKLFDEAFNGYSRGPLMNGDTQNHRNLFTFFDILLSVALIFFLMKFYHLFK